MKILKKIFGFISLFLIIGGIIYFNWLYFRNKQLIEVLLSNSIVRGSMGVLKKMGYSVLAIILGLCVSILYFRANAAVKKKEKAKKEEQKLQQKEQADINRQLQSELDDAKAETEQVRKENERIKRNMELTVKNKENQKTETAEDITEE